MAERRWFKGRAARALDAWYSDGDVGQNLRDARDVLRNRDVRRDRAPSSTTKAAGAPTSCIHIPTARGPGRAPVRGRRPPGLLGGDCAGPTARSPVPIMTYWMNGVEKRRSRCTSPMTPQHVAVTIVIPNDPVVFDARGPRELDRDHRGDSQVHVTQTSGPRAGRNRRRPIRTDVIAQALARPAH